MRRISTSLAVTMATVALLTSISAEAQCNAGITPVSFRGAAPFRSASAIAWTGSRFGLVKIDDQANNSLFFTTYNADFSERTPDVEVTNASFSGALSLIWNGSEFGLFYFDRLKRLTLQRLTDRGEFIAPPMPILLRFNLPSAAEYDFAWDPTRQAYVIVHSVTSSVDIGLWISAVGLDGLDRFSHLVTGFMGNPATPRIAVNNSGTIAIVYQRDAARTTINYSVIGPDNAIKGGGFLMTGRDPRIASDGASFVVIAQNIAATPKQVRWAAIGGDGSITLTDRTLFTTTSIDIMPVALLWNATRQEWAYTYLDSKFGFGFLPGELRLRRFIPSGSLISDTNFTSDQIATTFGSDYPIVWTGNSYVAALARLISPSQRTESYLAVNCPLAATIAIDREVITPNQVVTFTASASGGVSGYLYRWDFGDGSREEIGPIQTHAFPNPGTYTVTLRVTDTTGTTTVSTMTVRVVTTKRRALRR